MNAILAVYGTAYGQTERIVRRIADRWTALGVSVTLHRGDALPDGLDLDRFGAVLVAASVIRGKHQSYIRGFVQRHAARLNAVPSVFVSVSGAAGGTLPKQRAEAEQYAAAFLDQTPWRPALTAPFGGALAYTKYSWLLRWILKRIVKQSGGPTDTSRDHDLTDWDAVDRFADRCAAQLLQPVAP